MDSAELITILRERAGMSKAELARRVGVCTQSVCNWELGHKCPTADSLLKVIRATGHELVIREQFKNGDYLAEHIRKR